jgi:hypothetical protein
MKIKLTRSLILTACFLNFNFSALAADGAHSQPLDSFSQECPQFQYPGVYQEVSTLADLQTKIGADLKKLGLQVEWQSGNELGSISWEGFADTTTDIENLKRLSQIVVFGLKKYPRGWFPISGLEKIHLVKNLKVTGQLRKAMPEPFSHSVYYASNGDLLCDAGMEERVHHEYYHFIENKFAGNMYFHDPKWLSLNSSSFAYGHGGTTAYSNGQGWQNLGHPQSGIVSLYALTAPEEDKAETFGFMMSQGYNTRIANWSVDDTALKEKYEYLVRFFSEASNGTMDSNFFTQLKSAK